MNEPLSTEQEVPHKHYWVLGPAPGVAFCEKCGAIASDEIEKAELRADEWCERWIRLVAKRTTAA